VRITDDVLAEIAASVRGGVRDAETALERILPLAREADGEFDLAAYRSLVARVGLDATVDVVERLLGGDARAGLHFARELQDQGIDEREALGELVEVLRWLLLLKVDGPDTGLVPVSGALRERLQRLAEAATPMRLDAMVSAGILGRERLRRLEDRAVVLEVSLVRMAQAGELPALADLLAEVRAGGVAAQPAAPQQPARRFTPPPRPPGTRAPDGAPPAPPSPSSASAPSPSPAPPRAPAAVGGDLRARVLTRLHDQHLLAAAVELCTLTGPDDHDVVTVAMRGDVKKMFRDRLTSPDGQTKVTKAIHDAAGRPVKVQWRLAAGDAGTATPAPKPVAKVEPGPNANRVMGALGGRVVQVNPDDRAPKPEPAADEPPPDEPPVANE
jgi:DNA polymerase III gamma/tau subunit